MKRRPRMGWWLCVTGFCLPTHAVLAQQPCPDGERLVAMTQAGHGIASHPICEADGAAPSATRKDPTLAPMPTGDEVANLSQVMLDEKRRDLDTLSRGWLFSPPGIPKCMAAFFGKGGDVHFDLSRTYRRFDSPTITFVSPRIPLPTRLKRIDTELVVHTWPAGIAKQDRHRVKMYQTRTVVAKKMVGSYVLYVPSNQALLADLQDVMRFQVLVEGKPMFDVTVTGANEAQARMTRCLQY